MKIKLLLLLPLLLIGHGCKQVYDISLPPKALDDPQPTFTINGQPEVSEKTVVVTAAAASNIVSVGNGRLVLSDLSGIKAVQSSIKAARLAALEDVKLIQVGDILVAEPSENAPRGFLIEVTSVIRDGQNWLVDYVDAKLNKLFKKLDLKSTSLPVHRRIGFNEVKFKIEGSPVTSIQDAKDQKVQFDFQFDGYIDRTQTTDLAILIDDFTLKNFSALTTEKTIVSLTGKESIGVKGKKRWPALKKLPLANIVIPFRFFAGPVPVSIFIDIEPYARLEANVTSLAIDMDFIKRETEKVTGYTYSQTDGWKNVDETISDVSKNGVVTSASVQGELKAAVGLAVNFSFYNQNTGRLPGDVFKGITVELEVYGKITATCSTSTGLTTSLDAGAGGKVYIWFDLVFTDVKLEKKFVFIDINLFKGKFPGAIDFCGPDDTPSDPAPVDNNTTRTPIAVSTSDPHMKTFDQAAYDFMAAGEFVAAKSGTDRFEIQVRQQEIKRSDASGQVSFNTGLAMHTGSDAICIYPDGRLFINRARVSLTSAGYPLRGGWAIQQTSQGMNVISIGGDQIEIRLFGTNLDYYISLATTRKSNLKGLLGNFDGIATNDLVRGDNGQAVQNTFAMLYPAFADSWRIKQAESLFVYDAGTNTDTYTDKAFPRQAVSLTAQQRANAETVCKNQGITDPVALQNCIVDVGLTGDNTLASRSLDFQTAGNVLNSFAIGQFLTTDVQLAYTSATAENSAAVLNSAGSGFSRVVMQQGVNIRNGFVSEFSFTAEEFNPASCFFLAIWPTTPNTRNQYQTRAGFCFGISNGVPITFFDIDQANVLGLPARGNIAPFNDKQVHRVRISEKRLSTGKFRVEIFYDNIVSPVVSIDNEESIAQIIDAPQNTGYIEFQINTGSPTKVKVFNWMYQAQ